MDSKDIRDLILTLIILAIGIKVLAIVGQTFIASFEILDIAIGLVRAIDSISNLFIIFLTPLIIILIIWYFSKRSKEKKQKMQAG